MARLVHPVVSFLEDPSIGALRSHGLTLLLPVLAVVKNSLPDIGLGAKALLQHAIDHPVTTGTALPFTRLDEWLAVSMSAARARYLFVICVVSV